MGLLLLFSVCVGSLGFVTGVFLNVLIVVYFMSVDRHVGVRTDFACYGVILLALLFCWLLLSCVFCLRDCVDDVE